jgi:deoxyribonuclease V
LDKKIPIVGIAKRNFINNKKNVIEVLRGESKNPIFVTAIGIGLVESS